MVFTESSAILQDFKQVRQATVSLCQPLRPEDTVVQPIVDVSPPKWHLGHSTWFFENFILAEHYDGYKLFNPRYNYLFNSYYESQGERVLRSNRGNITRPTVEEILEYRNYVDRHMSELLESSSDNEKLTAWATIGLQHEMQHQELLVTDIKYILGNNPLYPVYSERQTETSQEPAPFDWIEMPSGLCDIGFDGEGFCFDNEKGKHQVFLHAFAIANRPVNNQEYLRFMEDGGYQKAHLWLMEGWEWAKQQETHAPLYWYKMSGSWYQYTLAGLQKVLPQEPVTHLSFYEADAFARWSGHRLPTEFEWEAACKTFSPEASKTANFMESQRFHPAAQPQGADNFMGDVWEWTNSAYLPYPFYQQAKGALGEYNGKFMVNQMVLKGGSCATPIKQIRPEYRNFFHPDKQWQFTGFRLAKHIKP